MVQKVVTMLTDDLDGGDADESLEFSWEGIDYRIDLSERNADKFRKALSPYLQAAQRVGGRARRSRATATIPARARANGDTAAIRAWAAEQGYDVNERGRIANDIREAYAAAH